jgi:hypothetical protein
MPRKRIPVDLRSLARSYTEVCVRTLAALVVQETVAPAARVAAAALLLDRGWGRPVQPIAGDDGQPLTIVVRQILETRDGDLTPTGTIVKLVN